MNKYFSELDELLDVSDKPVLDFDCTNRISPSNYNYNCFYK